jgi:hypothetical protein
MKTSSIVAATLLVASSPAWALTVLEPGYTVQSYSSYSGAVSIPYSMVFDNAGNLYVSQPYAGQIVRVSPGGAASPFAGIFNSGFDWTGGTAYGDYLYTAADDNVVRITPGGTTYPFAVGLPATSEVAVDRTGNYGGHLYVTTGGQDHIYSVDTAGNVNLFTSWPGWTDGGGPIGIEFDTTGKYNRMMYVGTYFGQQDAAISGLFAVNAMGGASRFSASLVQAFEIGFDAAGLFGNDMFVVGAGAWGGPLSLWRVSPDGVTTEFAADTGATISSLAFGNDGAMYVAEYLAANDSVSIVRIVPEPSTPLLLIIAALALRWLRRA